MQENQKLLPVQWCRRHHCDTAHHSCCTDTMHAPNSVMSWRDDNEQTMHSQVCFSKATCKSRPKHSEEHRNAANDGDVSVRRRSQTTVSKHDNLGSCSSCIPIKIIMTAGNGNTASVAEEEEWTAERLRRATYKDLGTPQEVENRFVQHLMKSSSCRASLDTLLTSQSSTTRDYSLEINVFGLLQSDPVLGHMLLRFPATLLHLLEKAIVKAQHLILSMPDTTLEDGIVKGDQGDNVMTRVHARLVHLPPTCCITSLAAVEASDVGKIVQLTGTVVRASPVQMYESARTYQCTGKHGCNRSFVEYADLEQQNNALGKPESCPLFGQGGERCKGTNLTHVGSVHTDYQEIKIQEAASRIGVGRIPRSLLIKLQHDLVDKCQPGDEVVLVGSLLAQWHTTSVMPEVECNVGMALKAHSIRVVQEKGASAWKNQNEGASVGELEKLRQEFDAFWDNPNNKANPIAARDFICKAVCPKLYGMSMVKLGLLITLIGGVGSDSYKQEQLSPPQQHSPLTSTFGAESLDPTDERPDAFHVASIESTQPEVSYTYDGHRHVPKQQKHESVHTRRRDQSHMLLVGDPGTGKSQFLRFAAALCPRSVLTTGVGTTSAGLTCAAVREGNGKEFVLEAGALVLADKGVCCIDEFGCIQDQDRTTIHEAMEQQTLSVAKAGIVCKLNCRATIIAVMNPRDCLYDNHASLSRNTGLGTPLLSRFDIIFKMVDSSDARRDDNIATYLLNRAIQGAGFECNEETDGGDDEPWNMEKLRAYIAMVKDRFNPTLSDDAATLLEKHYERCRMSKSATIPMTVRFLESVIRLSQAHARLMYRNVATLQDAVAVLRVMECSAFAYGGFDGNVPDVENIMYCDPMSMDFSTQADLEFLCFEYKVLKLYGMLDRLSSEEQKAARDHMGMGYSAASAGANQGWSPVANPREVAYQQPPNTAGHIETDHYGRLHFSQPTGTYEYPEYGDTMIENQDPAQKKRRT